MPAPRTDPAPVEERIEDVDVSVEMQGSFLEYAYSVIYSRALPDARDGLKPVQRRILYQMADMGLRPDRGHVKSARVVGEVMGKLHPHGDAPIYDALVRLAQPFSLRVPLVDGHGNFGSLDDGPAAPRYTEARLAPAALALTENLDEDVVDFIPNYDGQFQQPEVLPAAYPNLLVNGATGIAVGMATNMAPHNLIEVVSAAIHLLENPDATVEDLMEFVPGPDFPSGGIVMGLEGVKDAYAKGRGAFKVRAKVAIESLGPRRTGLVVTELPYQVGPERIIEKIKDAVQAKRLTGIADVTDLTDRNHGLRLVIGIKTGFDPQAVLDQLYRLTPLEDSFSINNVALVEGQPQTLGLKELLRVYLDHRIQVVTRRSRYRLRAAGGAPAPGRGPAHRDPRHRRGDPGHPHLGRQRAGAHPASRGLRPQRGPGRVHPRAAPAASDEVLADRARGRARRAQGRDRAAAGAARQRGAHQGAGGARARGRRRRARHASAHDADERQARRAPPDARCARARPADRRCPDRRGARHDRARGARRPRRRPGARGAGAAQQARRHPRDGDVHHPRRARRGHDGGPRHPVQPRRPALRAAGVRPARPRASCCATTWASPTRRSASWRCMRFDDDTPLALGTRQGIVKRVVPSTLPVRPELEIIGLKPGDAVVGAASAPDDAELVFIANDAQLLRFAASAVRPQGAPAGGMAGINLSAEGRGRVLRQRRRATT